MHHICLLLELIQALTAGIVMLMAYWANPLHLYGSIVYSFIAIFSHIVVHYVCAAIGQNVRQAYLNHPENVDAWLVHAIGRVKMRILPFTATHTFWIVGVIALAMWRGTDHAQPAAHRFGAWGAAILGWVCVARIYFIFRDNTEYLTSFVTRGSRPAAQYEIGDL